ncbi:MAG: hypothetical protein GXY25_04100 [Pirellulaceae bacterium]|mgnify:FL=1|nr:hypothetical protein [Thermoguttaceae bacterium]MDI9445724.1 hypothetical protein [Planctomycetota bacterium]NLY99698.1 hypothetical protein [Pirellulaceae bacterium]
MLLHALALLAIAMAMRDAPRRGAQSERSAEVGIALKHTEGDAEYFETEARPGQAEAKAPAAEPGDLLAELLRERPATDPSDVLPQAPGAIGTSAVDPGGPIQPGSRGGSVGGGTAGLQGKARVSVFGTSGEGFKFVYVFDRSSSMEGSGRSPLAASKQELIASLDSLQDTHQFQIVFYNEEPTAFNPSGEQGRLAFATEQNKERARRFVGSVSAYGSTNHVRALEVAIKMQPDVIFFLTDADEPRLSARQLYELRRRAAGIQINAIEFGIGPKAGGDNFLARLARENGGEYAYRDITKFALP